mmetsp:Transcript_30790/g.87072  ORF Transcript_30790/g.87072 Transcript_30790/m.87072 type:complete len:291 (-) Transcript_30790:11-883(-)
MEFIGNVKTSHANYPKAYMEKVLQPLPAGSRLVMKSTVDGVDLMAIGYKYNRRKVLSFVATLGAGVTTDGEPYIQKWADNHGNVLTRPVPRPSIISTYFSNSPRVDNHNQSRQHDLGLEEMWPTKDPWFRLHTTVMGMGVVDAWKLCKHHLHGHHRLVSSTILEFADELSFALLTNGLRDREDPSRVRVERPNGGPPLGDVTNTMPLTAHIIGSRPRVNGRTRQGRCRWCIVKSGRESWTSRYCMKCDLDLCVASNGHSRTCWEEHIEAPKEELRRIAKRHRIATPSTTA